MLVFNFCLKVKRMINKGVVDMCALSTSEKEACSLLSTDDLENCTTPEFCTKVFNQCNESLELSLKDRNKLHQITTHLDYLAKADPGFTYRMATAADGSATGFVWMTPVIL